MDCYEVSEEVIDKFREAFDKENWDQLFYKKANGKYQLSADQLLAADVNGDGVVNTTDAALIYRVANGKLSKFPVEK